MNVNAAVQTAEEKAHGGIRLRSEVVFAKGLDDWFKKNPDAFVIGIEPFADYSVVIVYK